MAEMLTISTSNSRKPWTRYLRRKFSSYKGTLSAKAEETAQAVWGDACGLCLNIEANERGLWILEVASFKNLVLTNTLGPHKPYRRLTWRDPDGKNHNQIVYILVTKRFRSGVTATEQEDILKQTQEVTMTWWWWPLSSSEDGHKAKPAKTQVWTWEVEGPRCGTHFPSSNRWEIRTTYWS